MKVLIILTNIERYKNKNLPTGLWLSELTHMYHLAHEAGYDVTLASPKGGVTPIDPESLKPLILDSISKKYWKDASFMEKLEHTKSLTEVIEDELYDCIYLAGGHGTMYDFPDDTHLQSLVQKHYEGGKIVVAICHGVGGLLNVRGENGDFLIRGKKITGFDWLEETLARRKKEVPFNLEAALEERGADYKKAFIPMTPHVVVDGNLITGQNPFSSKETAKVVMRELRKNRGLGYRSKLE